jgi:AraC-like DNA-binding protein
MYLIYNFDDINPYIINCGIINKMNCPPDGTIYDERVVKWFEIELIFWGDGYIYTEGTKIKTELGDLFFRTPGMVVQGVSPYHCCLIVFDMFYDRNKADLYKDPNTLNAGIPTSESLSLKSSESEFLGFSLPYVLKTIQFGKFEELFLALYNGFVNCKAEKQFYLKTFLMQILLTAYNEWISRRVLHENNHSNILNYTKIMAAKKHIDQNICTRISLSELGNIAELSPNFLCKVFKNIIGVTPIEYVNNTKIIFAKRFLIESNKSIKEIAYECGFENDSYFYTLFKKTEGISPSAYREKQRIIFPS